MVDCGHCRRAAGTGGPDWSVLRPPLVFRRAVSVDICANGTLAGSRGAGAGSACGEVNRMSMALIGAFLAACVAWANGANDISKGVATLIGSGLSSYRRGLA